MWSQDTVSHVGNGTAEMQTKQYFVTTHLLRLRHLCGVVFVATTKNKL